MESFKTIYKKVTQRCDGVEAVEAVLSKTTRGVKWQSLLLDQCDLSVIGGLI